jgi:hypothetical protein
MKRICLFLTLFFCGTQFGFAQSESEQPAPSQPASEPTKLHSTVDERFELTSIAARLAEYPEYSDCRIPTYAADIDSVFASYKKHPLVTFLKKIRRSHGISYNCISGVAYALEIRSGKIGFRAGYDLDNAASIEAIDNRWDKKTLLRYVELLNDFYSKSRFHEFYEQHSGLYAIAAEKMDEILAYVDGEWFEKFYGRPFGEPDIFIGLTNGPSNYGLSSPGEGYGIIIGCFADQNSAPRFSGLAFETIIHELNHNYADPLADEFAPQTEAAIERIAPQVGKMLASGAYDKTAMLPEWLTRLGTLMYGKEYTSEEEVSYTITQDARVGFIWQQRAFDFMANFTANREQYPYFRDFMPQLVAFFNFTADNFDKVVFEYENREPYVVSVYPAAGSELDISQETIEIRISFSEPMGTHAVGMRLNGNNIDAFNEIEIPEGWKTGGWEDDRTFVVHLKSDWVKKAEITGVTLLRGLILSKKNYSITVDYTVTYSNFK